MNSETTKTIEEASTPQVAEAYELALWNKVQHLQIPLPFGKTRIERCTLFSTDVEPILDPRCEEYGLEIYVSEAPESGEPQIEIENRGRMFQMANGQRIFTGDRKTIEVPTQIFLADTTIELTSRNTNIAARAAWDMLPAPTSELGGRRCSFADLGVAPSSVTLAHWFDALGRIQRVGAGSEEFLRLCADAVLEPGGLDMAIVVMLSQDQWKVEASAISDPDLGISFDREMINEAVRKERTIFHNGKTLHSLGVNEDYSAIAAPIRDASTKVVGVLFSCRAHHRKNSRRGIRPLEAQFVQLLADSITDGLTRMQQEAEAVRRRVLLEQAFPTQVVKELENNPDILDGREHEVSVLFCDVRGSSDLANRLDGKTLYRFLAELMDRLTTKILQYEGVVIDYFGDGLAAFWNAPVKQPDHARLAILAGQAVQDELPYVNFRWREILGQELQIGIGIHTGNALVGNSGSRRRVKYGPRGQTMNLACRVETATKKVGVPILVTGETRELVRDGVRARESAREDFVMRRVCRTRLPGIENACDLYAPCFQNDSESNQQVRSLYEEALDHFENKHFMEACDLLESLLKIQPDDRLGIFLQKHALARRDEKFSRRSGDERLEYMPIVIEAKPD